MSKAQPSFASRPTSSSSCCSKKSRHNLFRLRLQSETERLEAPSEIVKAKREIARIKTILRLASDGNVDRGR